MTGEKIYEGSYQTRTTSNSIQQRQIIDISSHPSGIYFLHTKTNKGISLKKVIKQ